MIKKLVLLITLSSQANALDLFKAEYIVFKDNKQIGTSYSELSKDELLYTIIDKTNGTHGMASFLGFKRTEESTFTYENNIFIPASYDMKQKVAFKKRHASYIVDQEKGMVYGNSKNQDWQNKTPTSFFTPNMASLKLFADICTKKKNNLTYNVLKNDKLKTYSFQITSINKNIIEVDKLHSNPNTITKTWLDTNQNCLPIRTYHKEKNEDVLETKLTKLTFYK